LVFSLVNAGSRVTEKFGYFALPRWASWLAGIGHRLPQGWLGRRLGFLLRKPVLGLGKEPVDVQVQGTRLRLYPRQNLSDKRLLCTPNLLDGRERKFMTETLPSGGWVIDIGANIGGYALLLARARADLRFLCVEPDPDMAERLRANIAFNDLDDRVSVELCAVTGVASDVRLFRDDVNRGRNSLIRDKVPEETDSIVVEGRTLLGLMDAHGIDVPLLVKLDIEGFELDVLKGFLQTVSPSRRPLFIQLEQHRKEPLNEAVCYALSQGYLQRMRTRMNVVLERI
jgi:FkbM family methyltransferase